VLARQLPSRESDEENRLQKANQADAARKRYADIFRDVEDLIDEHVEITAMIGLTYKSKLQTLVPSIGPFFTRLPLERAFVANDSTRHISKRRFVSPSFNGVVNGMGLANGV
jgi:IMP and pyridine-specific 5'-nucleotidase